MIELCVPKPSLNHVAAADDNREVASVVNHEPKRDGCGRGSEPDCAREVKRFARRITKLFPFEIASDPRGFKKRLSEILKRNLPPFAGRPSEQSITHAARLKAEGNDWQAIYTVVIPNHAQLDPATRRQAESNLRSANRSRRNARRRRNARHELLAQTTAALNVPLSETTSAAVALDRGTATEDPHARTAPIAEG